MSKLAQIRQTLSWAFVISWFACLIPLVVVGFVGLHVGEKRILWIVGAGFLFGILMVADLRFKLNLGRRFFRHKRNRSHSISSNQDRIHVQLGPKGEIIVRLDVEQPSQNINIGGDVNGTVIVAGRDVMHSKQSDSKQ